MSLFNKKTLKKAIGEAGPIPADHLHILQNWARTINDGSIQAQNETQIEGDFKSRIIETVLGYTPAGLGQPQTVAVQEQIGHGRVDVALGHFGTESKIIAPFELKGARTHDLDAPLPGRKETPVEQAWRYGLINRDTKWVLVSNYLEIRLYSYMTGTQEYEVFYLKDLTDPYQYARLRLLLSADNLLTGNTQTLLDDSAKADKDISDQLYADYKALRQSLIAAIPASNTQIDAVTAVGAAQKLLDRILFIAFAEDTKLLPANSLASAFEHADPYNPRPVWQNFRGLFRAVDVGNGDLKIPKYNGGLFAPDPAVDDIDLPDDICEGFKKIGDYDFESEVSVTILGHIFEQSVSDLERLLARARGEEEDDPKKTGTTGRRKRDGIVYTPDYIARFIVERTLGVHVEELFQAVMAKHAKGDPADYDSLKFKIEDRKNLKLRNAAEIAAWTEYRFKLQTLRVVDPACGSGVFLVMAFDYLKTEYDKVNAKLEQLTGAPDIFEPDAEILSQNLYGVDVNAESVEITRLSLWLKTAKRGKELASLDHTIRVGDSLIEDSNYAYLDRGFTWNTAFPEVFASGGFDVVLGNPPYVRQELLSPLKPYLKKRFEVYHGVADLYCYFFERGLRLLKTGGRMGYISSSTFFKTNSGKPLREYLPKNALIETITDFGDLQIFGGVTTYPAILTMRRASASASPLQSPSPPISSSSSPISSSSGLTRGSTATNSAPTALDPRVKPENDALVAGDGALASESDNTSSHQIQFWKLESLPKDNFSKSFEAHCQPYPQSALTAQSWELENPALRALRQKIVTGKPTLKEVYGSPLYGIKTGRNEAFVIDRQTRDRLVTEDPRSEEILKPWLEGKDLKRWRAEPRDLWLILLPKGWTKQHITTDSETDAWEWLKTENPAIATHLEQYANVCRKRSDKGDFWWELRACEYYNEFEKPKIVYPDLSQGAKFQFDKHNFFFGNTGYFLPFSEPALAARLNSKSTWFFLRGISDAMRGGEWRIRMFSQNIEQIPIPPASDTDKATLANLAETCQTAAEDRYARQQAFARRIPDLCPDDRDPKLNTKLKKWWQLEDFAAFRKAVKSHYKADIPLGERSEWQDWFSAEQAQINQLTARITRNEAEINTIVYRLFDLTPDEIELLEANI